ncbi:putative L-iditol 2-dehydrogenase [uncultured Eubacteriales bacterium]|uniref:Putative L-iditol 2-dehydrogenase n=1 Tax=uncultured Eubacteriales bacterium TaxID=172733 RepID=A0A212JU76_9FIRM|nr:putative L-iditol 2-dehydrogenase [uncultured Eubacteriales bacterium]
MKFTRACLVEPRKFGFFEVDEEPGAGQVLIKIAGCGMCNWELNFWDGHLNFQGYPHKLGHEFAGVVAAIGPDCKNLRVGDKVSAVDRGFGGFAQYRVTNEAACEKLADHIDPKYAMGEPQKCIITVLRATEPEAGDYGVVLGAGPMGMWCIQGLSGHLLSGLIAVDVDDSRLEMARSFGASHVINSAKEDVVARIQEITSGRMADFVIEGTGIPSLLDSAQDYLKSGRGRLILMSSHHEACQFDFRKAVDRGLEFRVAHPPYSRDERDDFRRAVCFINNGTFINEPLVSHKFKLSEIQTAFETMEHKPRNFMKGLVVPD